MHVTWLKVGNCLLISVLLVAVLLFMPVGDRVGDGGEYYAMLFSWVHSHRPWADPQSFDAYNRYVATRDAKHNWIATEEFLRSLFRGLAKGDGTQDFNHFWFYSLLAAMFFWIPKSLGLDIGLSFTLLHFCLLIFASVEVRRKFGELGLLSFLLIVICSPMLWFINKAHTEFFTFCLSVVGFTYLSSSALLPACLTFAILSTQNPPFVAISFGIAAYWLFQNRTSFLKIRDAALLSISAGFCLIHPVYYMVRHGTITPQVMVGGATLRVPSWKEVTVWLLDPDVGLLANWPLGILIIIAFAMSSYSRARRVRTVVPWGLTVFALFYVGVLSYCQAMTTNFNSGATVSVTRYALWYLWLFVIFLYSTLLWSEYRAYAIKALFAGAFLVLAVLSIVKYAPIHPESYLDPTLASRILYKYFPSVYDPLPNIFMGRNLGRDRRTLRANGNLYSNGDCNKVLAFRNDVAALDEEAPVKLKGCQKPGENYGLAKRLKAFFAANPKLEYAYFTVTDDPMPPILSAGEMLSFSETRAEAFLGRGWSFGESWGRWTEGPTAEVCFRLSEPLQKGDLALHITATAWMPPGSTERVVNMVLNGQLVRTFSVPVGSVASTETSLKADWLSEKNCLVFEMPDAVVSPATFKLSADPRRLGFGVISFKFETKPSP